MGGGVLLPISTSAVISYVDFQQAAQIVRTNQQEKKP